jgi:hypothetical protein
MRKQELIHIHRLLVVTRNHLADQADIEIPADAFDEYDEHEVGPTAIAKRKEAHKEAVEHLLDGVHTTLTTQRTVATASIDASSAHSS